MSLQKALSVLSKSSPFAVSTKGASSIPLKMYKDYLYIPTDIEKKFRECLREITDQKDELIFLCGSSGDGKSEILTRCEGEFSDLVDFHLDGTHSYSPDETAIQALDACFTRYKERHRPLVVGINIGMLGNYAEEGSEEHEDIRESIRGFLAGATNKDISWGCKFLYFENFPKFSFDSGSADSVFAREVMEKLTEKSDRNPFYVLYLKEREGKDSNRTACNFGLLSQRKIQDVIVETLVKARLVKDQFLTARTLLDFLYRILCSGEYLFDALFMGGDNELLDKIKEFDPAILRSKELDQFALKESMRIECPEFEKFKKDLLKLDLESLNDPYSYIRLFYLFKNFDVGNNYHKRFREDLCQGAIHKYIEVWKIHRDFSKGESSKASVIPFYKKILIAGIYKYINRNAPKLGAKEILVSQLNGFLVATELDVKPDFSRLRASTNFSFTSFDAYLTVQGKPLMAIPISLNLFDLLLQLQAGYQPSRHGSASILLLDEVVEQIVKNARQQSKLIFVGADRRYDLRNVDGEYIEVEGY